MPWGPDDAPRHTKAASTAALRQLWATVANNALQRTGDDGQAIREANAAVAKARSKGIAHKWLSIAAALSLALLPLPARAQTHPAPNNGGGQSGTPTPAGLIGDGSNITALPYGATTPALLSALAGRIVSVTDYGAKCDDLTDDSAAISAALAHGPAMVPPGATCVIDNTVTLAPNATLYLPANSTITWMGGTGGTMFATSQTSVTDNAGLVGIGGDATLNPNGLAGTLVRLDSGQGDTIEHLSVPDNLAAGGIALDLHADIGSAPSGNLFALNVRDIYVSGQAGTCVAMTGSGGGTPTTVVTDNNFYNITCTNLTAHAINFVQDADTDRFYGFYGQLDANNAIGYAFGSANYTAVEGVYENAIYGSAIDTFAGYTGRIGAKFGDSPNNTLDDFVQSPVAEGGVFTYAVAGVPEYIRYINAGSGSPDSYMRIFEGNSSITTAPASAVACTGIGTGSCALLGGSTMSSGTVVMSPSGAPSSVGTVELTSPVTAQSYVCTLSLANGTGQWQGEATAIAVGIDNTHTQFDWTNYTSALTAGSTYSINYYCRLSSTGWQ